MHQQRISKTPRRRRRQLEDKPLVATSGLDTSATDELLVLIDQVLEVV